MRPEWSGGAGEVRASALVLFTLLSIERSLGPENRFCFSLGKECALSVSRKKEMRTRTQNSEAHCKISSTVRTSILLDFQTSTPALWVMALVGNRPVASSVTTVVRDVSYKDQIY